MRLWGRNLACVRGGREVFRGIEFAVDGGAALLVTGRNGAGKSTLLRLAAGLLRRAEGELGLDGGDAEASIGEQAHYLGHQDALKPSLTVAENLGFWTAFLGGAPGAGEALAEVGLASLKDLPAAYLSAGQKRRLSIARLLAVKRPIWLLDEPTSALDVKAQAQFADFMRAHLASGGVIMAAVHGSIGLNDARQLEIGGRA